MDLMELLAGWENGCEDSTNQLKTLLYHHLKQVCRSHLEHYRGDIDATHIINNLSHTTSLLHQVLLQLVPPGMTINEERRLNNYLSLFIRNVLRDEIRKLQAKKRTPDAPIQSVPDELASQERFIALDSALSRLKSERPQAAEVFSMRYFLGFEIKEIAQYIDCSMATAYRELALAQAFLRTQIDQM